MGACQGDDWLWIDLHKGLSGAARERGVLEAATIYVYRGWRVRSCVMRIERIGREGTA